MRHEGDGNDGAATVSLRGPSHTHARLTVGDEAVAREHKEGSVADLIPGTEHRLAQAKRLVLVREGNGHFGGLERHLDDVPDDGPVHHGEELPGRAFATARKDPFASVCRPSQLG